MKRKNEVIASGVKRSAAISKPLVNRDCFVIQRNVGILAMTKFNSLVIGC